MRKFFKSLAVLLALTLIVGVVPAAAADSLTMAKEKTLYLGGSQGAKEDGTNCKITAKKKVANMIKGFDADTMTVVLSSADKSIVKTTKAGRIVAKSIGTTTVSVAVLDATEKEIFKQDLKVKVKKNATDVTVTGIVDGDSFKVGQTVEVTLPRAGVDTDERELTVDKADNVEITKGEKARVYNVKFLKAGDVTFTAKAFQSTLYPVATAKKDIKVTVANPAPTGIKVVASNAYELTFDTDVEAAGLFKDKAEIANDACYYMLNDTKVTFSAINAIKATGNTVKVTMYDNFASGTTYYVVINGCDPLAFVIAGTAAKDVESIAILTDTVEVNKAVQIKVALYNADGVDITSSVGTDAVTYTSTNLNSYVDGQTLNMYNVGETTDLTATFTYYDPNNNYEAKTKTATKKITAVAPAADVFKELVYSVDGSNAPASRYYNNPKTYIALGDTGFKFKAVIVYTNGSDTKDHTVQGKAGDEFFNGKALYAKIPEESVALLSSDNNDGTYDIIPNSVGKTNVFIGYDDSTGAFKTVAVAPIEVKAKRYPHALSVKATKSNLNTTALVGDTLEIQAEVKDQYGDYIDIQAKYGGSLVLTQNDQSKGIGELLSKTYSQPNNDGKWKIVINENSVDYKKKNATEYYDTANIVFTTKVDGCWDSDAPSVACSFTAKMAGEQNLETQPVAFANVTGVSTLDTTVSSTTEIKRAKLVASTSSNGYFTGNVGVDFVETVPTKDNVWSDMQGAKTTFGGNATGVAFQLVIKRNGTAINPTTLGALSGFLNVNDNAGTITLDNFKYDTTSKYLTKLDSGYGATYTFSVYKIVMKENKKDSIVISNQTLVVKVTDSQVKPSFTQLAEKIPSSGDNAGTFDGCFNFSWGGKTNYKSKSGDSTYNYTLPSAATNAYFVKEATVQVSFSVNDFRTGASYGNAGKYDLTSTINKLIKPAN